VCLIRETKKTRSVGVPPGTGLGNTDLRYCLTLDQTFVVGYEPRCALWYQSFIWKSRF